MIWTVRKCITVTIGDPLKNIHRPLLSELHALLVRSCRIVAENSPIINQNGLMMLQASKLY